MESTAGRNSRRLIIPGPHLALEPLQYRKSTLRQEACSPETGEASQYCRTQKRNIANATKWIDDKYAKIKIRGKDYKGKLGDWDVVDKQYTEKEIDERMKDIRNVVFRESEGVRHGQHSTQQELDEARKAMADVILTRNTEGKNIGEGTLSPDLSENQEADIKRKWPDTMTAYNSSKEGTKRAYIDQLVGYSSTGNAKHFNYRNTPWTNAPHKDFGKQKVRFGRFYNSTQQKDLNRG